MKKFKIKSNKALVLTIGLLLALSLSLVFSANGIAVRAAEAESGLPMAEAREYWKGDISEEFDPSSVLVVMDKRTGAINKRHKESFFGDFPKEAVLLIF